ncbi:MAG: hypothetical protein GYB31_09865 [Bacteroidetes bacterium]|nr:hypothetical protein [Bacteroidota bacterium]
MRLFIPAKCMNKEDLGVALSALKILASLLTPKHHRKTAIKIPLKEDQFESVLAKLPKEFSQVEYDYMLSPQDGDFIFMPASEEGLDRIRHFQHPVIGYKVPLLTEHYDPGSVMLIDPKSEAPEKQFAATLQMLHFDPGAQRMMWKNIWKKMRREKGKSSMILPQLGRSLKPG